MVSITLKRQAYIISKPLRLQRNCNKTNKQCLIFVRRSEVTMKTVLIDYFR